MRRGWQVLILVAASLWVAGCDAGPVDSGLEPPTFSVGQRWLYTYDAVLRDSLGVTLNAYHDSIEVRVAAVGETVLGMPDLVRMEARSLMPYVGPGPSPGIESVWYRATATSLVEVAYRNPAAVPVVMMSVGDRAQPLRRGTFFHPIASMQTSVASDTTIAREDPRIVLQYPLVQGASWDSFHIPWLLQREVVAIESIRIIGRDIPCARIKSFGPGIMAGLRWDDWVAPLGLLRRNLIVELEGMDQELNPLGRMTETETLELVSM